MAVWLAVAGAVCWGIAPIFGKLGLRHLHPMDGLAARTLVTMAFVGAWLVAAGRFHRIVVISGREWVYLGIEAFLATLAGDIAYYAALKAGSAGITAVALSLSPVLTIWASAVYLKEAFTPLQIVGTGLVIAGILLVVMGHGQRLT